MLLKNSTGLDEYPRPMDTQDLDAGALGGESRESATAKHLIGQWPVSVDQL
ncbi:hypothetical protein E8E14_000632 [Neopestalotiopsis sp. 37M]|nr:hypothetical protein E8E14_000632 [Neopestalotiopsis sp. 37M]